MTKKIGVNIFSHVAIVIRHTLIRETQATVVGFIYIWWSKK